MSPPPEHIAIHRTHVNAVPAVARGLRRCGIDLLQLLLQSPKLRECEKLGKLGGLLDQPTEIQGCKGWGRLAPFKERLLHRELEGEQLQELLVRRRVQRDIEHTRRYVHATLRLVGCRLL